MRTIHNQRYMAHSSLPLHRWSVLVDEIGLRHKGITDLWCTHNKNTIFALECWYEAYFFESAFLLHLLRVLTSFSTGV